MAKTRRQQKLLNYFKPTTQEEPIQPIQQASAASSSSSVQTTLTEQKPEVSRKRKWPIVIIKTKKKPVVPSRKKKAPIIIDDDDDYGDYDYDEEDIDKDMSMDVKKDFSEDMDMGMDEDDEIFAPKLKKRRRIIQEDSEEEEDVEDAEDAEEPITVSTEKVASGTTSNVSKQPISANANFGKYADEDMLEEDLEFLDKTDILKSRTRGKRKGKFAEGLEKLKDRKAKLALYEDVEDGPMDSFVSSSRRPLVISSSDESDGNDDEQEDDDDNSEQRYSSDDADFVVDDDIVDGRKVEAPAVNAELPAEFSTTKSMSFKRQMDFFIQSLIESVLNPSFCVVSSQKYLLANETVNKRVQAYRDSMVTSDVWHPEFKIDLDTYTKWAELDRFMYDGSDVCEACRGNKPASISIKLYSEEDADEFETYNLGSECRQKALIYHKMKHFRAHMYEKVHRLVNDRRYNANTSQEVFENLLQSGHVRTLRKSLINLFANVVIKYNPRGQRAGVAENDSDDSSDDEDMY
ncbi:hypothetical protein MBANPS3_005504 [Mucor bainieri]